MKKTFLKAQWMLAVCSIIFISSCKKDEVVTSKQITNTTNTNFVEQGTNSNPETLSVELVRFETTNVNGQIVIEWESASERTNYCYEVERSQDGVNYTIIAQQFISSSESNSTVPKNYLALDPSPLSGNSYYRLKQVCTDYTYETFEPTSVYNK